MVKYDKMCRRIVDDRTDKFTYDNVTWLTCSGHFWSMWTLIINNFNTLQETSGLPQRQPWTMMMRKMQKAAQCGAQRGVIFPGGVWILKSMSMDNETWSDRKKHTRYCITHSIFHWSIMFLHWSAARSPNGSSLGRSSFGDRPGWMFWTIFLLINSFCSSNVYTGCRS